MRRENNTLLKSENEPLTKVGTYDQEGRTRRNVTFCTPPSRPDPLQVPISHTPSDQSDRP